MKCRQYGVYLKNTDRETKVVSYLINVFYEREHALSIEREFRNLDSIPNSENYFRAVQELKKRCRVQIVLTNLTDYGVIETIKNKTYYKDEVFGSVELTCGHPISIEGW